MPEAPTVRRTEWHGRSRKWLWLGVATGTWLIGLVLAYVWIARQVSASLEQARAELAQAVATLPSAPRPAANPTPSAPGGRSSIDWIAATSGAFSEALGHQTLPPRLPGGVARTLTVPIEVFASQPHYGISSERTTGPQTAAPECGQIDPEILGDKQRLANWRAELEDQPYRLLADRACYALVVEEYESLLSIPNVCFAIEGVVPTPPEHWFEVLEREQLPAPTPALAGAVWAARRLADSAVVHAARNDASTARDHLRMAFAVCDALAGLEWVTGFVAWSEAEFQVLERVGLCLVLLEPGEVPAELDAHLERLAPRERYLASLPGELRLIERDFVRAKLGRTSRARSSGGDEFGAGPLSSLQLDQELADNFRAWVAHASWAGVAPYSAGPPTPYVHSALNSNVFNFRLMPPSASCRHPWGELAALKELLQLARIAAREGAAAAQASAAGRIDPFSGGPFLSRWEADGTLVLWSVGEDRKNDDAQPRLTCDPTLDLVVRVPTR